MDRDLTQEELAELAGIDRSSIQRLESGINDAKISHLLLVSRALNVHVVDLLT